MLQDNLLLKSYIIPVGEKIYIPKPFLLVGADLLLGAVFSVPSGGLANHPDTDGGTYQTEHNTSISVYLEPRPNHYTSVSAKEIQGFASRNIDGAIDRSIFHNPQKLFHDKDDAVRLYVLLKIRD